MTQSPVHSGVCICCYASACGTLVAQQTPPRAFAFDTVHTAQTAMAAHCLRLALVVGLVAAVVPLALGSTPRLPTVRGACWRVLGHRRSLRSASPPLTLRSQLPGELIASFSMSDDSAGQVSRSTGTFEQSTRQQKSKLVLDSDGVDAQLCAL